MKARIVDIKRFAVHDGPGIRTTLFLKGCPLACHWCHNPETIAAKPELGFFQQKCIGCGRCAAACPSGAHTVADDVHRLDRSVCTGCGACAAACLNGALEHYGRMITADEAVAAVLEDMTFYRHSGGGCTLSGGEPLLQPRFCADVCERLHKAGVHCAIDTAGALPWTSFETVLPHADLFLYDLKHLDEDAHIRGTGSSNREILQNLRRLSASAVPVEVRMPLIAAYNDSPDHIRAVQDFLHSLPQPPRLQLLPYNALARSKYRALGRPDPVSPPLA